MIVCICRRVTEKVVRTAIDGGAHSLEEVARACRAGTGCGACHEMICEMIDDQARPNCPRQRLEVVSPYLHTLAGETA